MRAPRALRAVEALEQQHAGAGAGHEAGRADALIGRDARSGVSLKSRASTRIASKPAQM